MPQLTSRRATVTLPSDEQILITREFDAPKHLVYLAWTTPELVRRWWTAKRGEMTACEVDLRVGGRWRYAMRANAGFEVAFHGVYREVVPNERIVSTEVFEGAPDDEAVSTVRFQESGGITTVTILVEHASRAARDAHVESGMEDGLQDALALVEDVALAGITITRSFDAPAAAVFGAWTDSARFARWFGTVATPVDSVAIDLRPGGEWSARMSIDDGAREIPWRGRFIEVDAPRRLVLTITDQPGDEYDVISVEFVAGDGGTQMAFRQVGGHMDATGYEQARQGWLAFFNDLAAGLAAS